MVHPPIPSHLLSSTILDEIRQTPNEMENLSTLLSVRHENLSLLVHRSGEHLDELTLRNPYFIRHERVKHQPAFTLKLSHGSPIRRIIAAGTANHQTSTNILAASLAEIFLIRTKSVNDVDYSSDGRHWHILDPVQKWSLPSPLKDLCSQSSSLALSLCKDGQIYQWTPSRGCSKISGEKLEGSQRISCSEHPLVCYVSSSQYLHRYDLRSRRPSLILDNLPHCLNIKICRARPSELLLSCAEQSLLYDCRFLNTALERKMVPGSTQLNSIDVSPLLQDRQEIGQYW
jgi:hypothetical protein